MNFGDYSVLVIDHGLFIYVATKLAASFGRVLYFSPYADNGFPSSKRRQIGSGLDNVERCYDMWDAVSDVDLVVATDIYYHDVVSYLREQGKPVWGAGKAEALEVERYATKRLMETLGMNVVPYEAVNGVTALWKLLADKEDMWIKGSKTRGDLETFHWVNEQVSAPRLEKLLRDLGPRRHTMEFVIEPSIPGCEYGYDGYCIDGRFGQVALYGPEAKDAGYLGRVCAFSELPAPLLGPTLQLAPMMGELGCRGFYSNEVRTTTDAIKEWEIPAGTSFLIDPALRCGSPPSESYIELFSNWDEVIWAGAHGEVVDLIPEAAYAAQVVLKSEWVTEEYLPVFFPSSISRWVKLHNYCVYDGEVTVVPQDFPEFGSVIGLGDTQKAAEQAVLSHVKQIEAIDLEWKKDVFDELHDCIRQGESVGIQWG